MSSGVRFHVAPGGPLRGRLRVPGDKSISHRAVMLGAIAEGITEIQGFLEGEDCLATVRAMSALGVTITGPQAGYVVIHGVGRQGLKAPRTPLDLGNSGTALRLLAGLLCGQGFACELTGDASLSRRPMRRITGPLSQMGARIETHPEGTPPLHIRPVTGLSGIDYTMPQASAQVKSALLLAGLYAQGQTCVTESAPTRDHTERMLAGLGYALTREGGRICLEGGGRLRATHLEVPADISSAAFFMVGAAIAPGSDLILEHVGVNPTRTGIIDILRMMGAEIELMNPATSGGEPVADIRVHASFLHGITIEDGLVARAIDEFPTLFIAAACAQGETVLRGASELRVKESDRIQVMADGLTALGVQAMPTPDGMIIQGLGHGAGLTAGVDLITNESRLITGGTIASHGDHRVAMAFAMAGLRARKAITITDCANVNTSFPGFAQAARSVGLNLTVQG